MSLKIEVPRELLEVIANSSDKPLSEINDAIQQARALLAAPYWRPMTMADLQKPMGFISSVTLHEHKPGHPIPQTLRDRFDQIERDIMGNKMERDAVFTQMRTAAQCYFVDHPVKPPACATCEDHGVIGYTTGQTAESFEQGEAPCPDCQPEPITIEFVGRVVEGNDGLEAYFDIEGGIAALEAGCSLFASVGLENSKACDEDGSCEVYLKAVEAEKCTVPPPGWTCSREPGHPGPCAATPTTAD